MTTRRRWRLHLVAAAMAATVRRTCRQCWCIFCRTRMPRTSSCTAVCYNIYVSVCVCLFACVCVHQANQVAAAHNFLRAYLHMCIMRSWCTSRLPYQQYYTTWAPSSVIPRPHSFAQHRAGQTHTHTHMLVRAATAYLNIAVRARGNYVFN